MNKLLCSILFSSLFCFDVSAQNSEYWSSEDSLQVRLIYNEALSNGESYNNLRVLCKDVGHRLTGSPQAAKAIEWGLATMQELNLDTVYLQEIKAPHWERGDVEELKVSFDPGEFEGTHEYELDVLSIGGSVGTNGILRAQIIEVASLAELKERASEVKGKIVFYNKPMDPRIIDPFNAYGACAGHRYIGASAASKYGAVGVIVRSLGGKKDDIPHTGSMIYEDGVVEIPALSVSTNDADALHNMILKAPVSAAMSMNCESFEDIVTYNVIGEVRGSSEASKYMIMGGHLDSWDVGEGAHDDGAGCVQSMEALRVLLATGYRPRHSIRVILFMNEENGNEGGKHYADYALSAEEEHLLAMETDRGGFSPRGFSIDGTDLQVRMIDQLELLLEPYGLHYFEAGYAGVDIAPLKADRDKVHPQLLMVGLVPDPQRYFDYHHTEEDVFETVNQRELELGGASMSALLYLLDRHWNKINEYE
ncbi:MAG: M20/M25/M40 family metallo-hydrolase [Bacteroidia bacterium]